MNSQTEKKKKGAKGKSRGRANNWDLEFGAL